MTNHFYCIPKGKEFLFQRRMAAHKSFCIPGRINFYSHPAAITIAIKKLMFTNAMFTSWYKNHCVHFEIAWICKEIALFLFFQVFTHWSTTLESAFVANSSGRRGITSSNRSKSTFWEPWGSLDTAFLCSKRFKVRKHLMA